MNWENLFTEQRTGTSTITDDARSEYQRDFDRLIFSTGFRRMQNKTQVFPLPGVAFVHNRLTHSLEVSSVGRSLGKIIGKFIVSNYKLSENAIEFYLHELQNVIAAACLAHDIGNPPFGHSGEKAISKYFIENNLKIIEKNRALRTYFDKKEWDDLINFEGNANGFRYLTHNFNGKTPGGLRLTYTTLASMIKYPCESAAIKSHIIHRKKYNCFQTDLSIFEEICNSTGMDIESRTPLCFKRHPFSYLTEAADDICYNLIDVEDAQRLGIVPYHEVEKLFKSLIKCISLELKIYDYERAEKSAQLIEDDNDRISYLRAKCVNALTMICADRFQTYATEIIEGRFTEDLFGFFKTKCSEMKAIQKLSNEKIYNHKSVVKIEIVGYKVMYDLLSLFIPSILKEEMSSLDQKIVTLIPKQFSVEEHESTYIKVMSVLDFVSGMTDTYATKLYRDIQGIEIAKHD